MIPPSPPKSAPPHMDIPALIKSIEANPASLPEIIPAVIETYKVSSESLRSCLKSLLVGSADLKPALETLGKLNIPSTVCGKAVDEIEFLWVCETCRVKKTGSCYPCYCNTCFVKELHKGHDYTFKLGCKNSTCDCGDESWLVPASFCPVHKKKGATQEMEQYLPSYNKSITPLVIKELQRTVQGSLCSGRGLGLGFLIYGLFRELIGVSPAFTRMISESFFLTFDGISTTHCCVATTVEQANARTDPHSCYCSVLENIGKILTRVGEDKQLPDFVTELVRYSEKFADELYGAFWKGYCHIFDTFASGGQDDEERSQLLYKMLWQCSIEYTIPRKHIAKYYGNYISSFNYTIQRIKKLNIEKISRLAYYLMFDFYTFLNVDCFMGSFFLEKEEFTAGFIRSVAELEFSNSLTVRTVHAELESEGLIRAIPYTCEYFQRIFNFMIRGYDMLNPEINKTVLGTFKQSLDKLIKDTPNVGELNSFNIPLLRAFSYFLNKFIYQNGKAETHTDAASYFEGLKQTLATYLGVSKDEFHSFAYEVLRRVFRAHTFAAEADAGLWTYHDFGIRSTLDFAYGSFRAMFASAEVALIQNLLAMLPRDSVNLELLLELVEDDKLLTKAQQDKDKLRRLRERKWYGMCYLLFNTDCRLECYLNSVKESFWQTGAERARQLAKKTALRVLLQAEDKYAKYEHVDIQEVAKLFPGYLRGKELNQCLEGFLTRKPNFEYTLDQESLKYYDYSAFLRQRDATSSELNLAQLQKKHRLTEFNLFQAPPRLKEDMLYHQAILAALNMPALLAAFAKTARYESLAGFVLLGGSPEAAAEEKKELDSVSTSLLKIAYEVVCESVLPDADKKAFANAIKDIKVGEENKLLGNAQKRIMSAIHAEKEEVKEHVSSSGASDKLKERRSKIMGDFTSKMKTFADKHMQELGEITMATPACAAGLDEICSVCKEQLNNTQSYGRLCSIVKNMHYAKFVTAAYEGCQQFKGKFPEYAKELTSIPPSFAIRSCGHYIHLACYQSSDISVCPVCKTEASDVLPDVSVDAEMSVAFAYSVVEKLDPGLEDVSEMEGGEIFWTLARYVWKSIALGVSSCLSDLLYKRLTDIKYILKLLQYWRKDGQVPPKFRRPHLEAVIQAYLCPATEVKDLDDHLESSIAEVLSTAIQWIYFKHAYLAPDAKPGNILERVVALHTNRPPEISEDIIAVMTELCVLKIVLSPTGTSEGVSKLLSIVGSEDTAGKISGLQKLLLPKEARNILSQTVELLLATGKVKLDAKQTAEAREIVTRLEAPDISFAYKQEVLAHMLSTTKTRIGLISNLPDNFAQCQLQFFATNCPVCNQHIKEKFLCLLCGKILCGSSCKLCGSEIYLHAKSCNSDYLLLMHLFYGYLCVVSVGHQSSYRIADSLYKTASQRDVRSYTELQRSTGSEELEEYKLSRETYIRLNNEYVTDRLHLERHLQAPGYPY